MPPSELKKEARQALKGKWGKAVCITLVFLLLAMLIGFIQGLAREGTLLYNIIEIAFFVIEIPLVFGVIISFIKLKRGEKVSAFGFIKEGFTRFGKSLGIAWHTFIRLLLPLVCLILITILHLVLMFNNAGNLQLNAVFSILYLVLLIATVIYIACRALLYVLAYYISFDNSELSSKECVKKSEELMKGHRGNYFMLGLSFIGWLLLLILAISVGTAIFTVIFTLAISAYYIYLIPLLGTLAGTLIMVVGMLFLMPYMLVSIVCLYERIINKKETEKIEE